jgi:hypothetical protein
MVFLKGSAWQFPDYENAETFVDRLVRRGPRPVRGMLLEGRDLLRRPRDVAPLGADATAEGEQRPQVGLASTAAVTEESARLLTFAAADTTTHDIEFTAVDMTDHTQRTQAALRVE